MKRGEQFKRMLWEMVGKERNEEANQVSRILLMVRLVILLILLGLAVGPGKGVYEFLSNQEFNRFNDNLNTVSYQVSKGFNDGLSRIKIAHELISKLHQSQTRDKSHGSMPFVTLSGTSINPCSKEKYSTKIIHSNNIFAYRF